MGCLNSRANSFSPRGMKNWTTGFVGLFKVIDQNVRGSKLILKIWNNGTLFARLFEPNTGFLNNHGKLSFSSKPALRPPQAVSDRACSFQLAGAITSAMCVAPVNENGAGSWQRLVHWLVLGGATPGAIGKSERVERPGRCTTYKHINTQTITLVVRSSRLHGTSCYKGRESLPGEYSLLYWNV